MARRGRGGGSARTKPTPGGRPSAVNGSVNGLDEPGDEPGARTIGALALKRFVARGAGRGESDGDGGDGPVTLGPFDEDDLDPEHAATERVDFGAVRVPVPRGGEVSVEPEDGRLQAVHVMLPAGRLSVSALAAPRTGGLWPDLAAEIDESLREGGATVRSFTGEWGRELHARTGDASSLFVGVDGPRWMLYGVATGPTGSARELDAALRVMLRGTVVVRGRSPYPVRTVLPLTVPEHLSRPGPIAMPDRVPVPRAPAERAPTPPPPPARPAALVDAPTTITVVPDGLDTVPHGIPRRVPEPVADVERSDAGRPTRGPAVRGRDAAAEEDPTVSPGASEGEAQTEVTQTEVTQTEVTQTEMTQTEMTRTASRGLFRRRPERPARPAARPPQRRVSELIAEAERDRTVPRPDPAAERPAGPARPGRPGPGADDPGWGTAQPEPGETPRGGPASVPHERRPADGGEGFRSNGFVPRGLTHDEFGMPPVVDDGDADPTGYIPNGAAYGANGSANGESYWANGAGYGPWPEEHAVHDVPLDRADDHLRQTNGRYANGTHVNGAYVNGAYADGGYADGGYADGGYADGGYTDAGYTDAGYTDAGYTDGAYADGGYQDDSSPPAWPSLGAYGYDRPFGPDRELAADRDHVAGAGSDPDLWIEATAWASVVGSGAAPGAAVADVGADDWTVPMPVVRAAPVPEPEPVRPEPVRPEHHSPEAVPGAPRTRRARRAAEERAVGSPGRMPQPGTPERWRSERRPDEQPRSQWADSGWEAVGRSARGEPDRGAHASDRPRHGGHRAVEPGDDPTDRSARRHASAHGRHSEERDEVAERADRPRHRRPEH
jgi:Protein of unknown function (DUF3710)